MLEQPHAYKESTCRYKPQGTLCKLTEIQLSLCQCSENRNCLAYLRHFCCATFFQRSGKHVALADRSNLYSSPRLGLSPSVGAYRHVKSPRGIGPLRSIKSDQLGSPNRSLSPSVLHFWLCLAGKCNLTQIWCSSPIPKNLRLGPRSSSSSQISGPAPAPIFSISECRFQVPGVT